MSPDDPTTYNDNLGPAMDKIAETLNPTISKPGKKGSPAQAQILVRVTTETRDRWKQAAEHTGKPVSDFIRDLVNGAANEILECSHPTNMRRTNIRHEYCLKCGKQLR